MLVCHRTVYIPFIMTLIFENQCVKLIHLRTISLIDVFLPGIVYLTLFLVKSKSVASFKYNLKSIDLSSFLNCVYLEFEFILFLLCSLICNYGVTSAVLFVYPVNQTI